MTDPNDPAWAALVPELCVSDLEQSLRLYRAAGFAVHFRRDDPPFAYLDMGAARLMLEQDPGLAWHTAALQRPFGRGLNLQIEVPDVSVLAKSLQVAGFTAFRMPAERWYDQADGTEAGQRELLHHDPDGYLLRFIQVPGLRPVPAP